MLMKKEVIEDNENLKKEIKDLKKQLEEEKNAYNRMYNMYVEKDNIIDELEKYLNDRSEFTNFGVIIDKLQELKHKKIYGSVDSEIIYFDEVGSDKK